MPESKLISEFLYLSTSQSVHSILPANATTISYIWKPTVAGSVAEITRLIGYIEDNANFSAETYGAAAALTNGLTLGVYNSDGTMKYQLTDSHLPVKKNAQWGAYCFDIAYEAFGAGNNMLTWRWTFAKSGKPVYLSQSRGDYIGLTVADTLSTLVDHLMLVQGHYITTGPS